MGHSPKQWQLRHNCSRVLPHLCFPLDPLLQRHHELLVLTSQAVKVDQPPPPHINHRDRPVGFVYVVGDDEAVTPAKQHTIKDRWQFGDAEAEQLQPVRVWGSGARSPASLAVGATDEHTILG